METVTDVIDSAAHVEEWAHTFGDPYLDEPEFRPLRAVAQQLDPAVAIHIAYTLPPLTGMYGCRQPFAAKALQGRSDNSASATQNILRDNAIRFYGL